MQWIYIKTKEVYVTIFQILNRRAKEKSFGLPSNYVYTSSGHLLDTREGKNLCKELELTWKYPKQYNVIPLAPDLQNILQDLDSSKDFFTRSARGYPASKGNICK